MPDSGDQNGGLSVFTIFKVLKERPSNVLGQAIAWKLGGLGKHLLYSVTLGKSLDLLHFNFL